MLGPVQLLVIGFKGSRPPERVMQNLRQIKSCPEVRVIDVLLILVNLNRTVELVQMDGMLDDLTPVSGNCIEELFLRAGAAQVLGESTTAGYGYLFRGDDVPRLEQLIPPGSGGLALLLEHRWAVTLRDAVVETSAYPLADAWIGREGLREISERVGA